MHMAWITQGGQRTQGFAELIVFLVRAAVLVRALVPEV